MDTTTFTNFLTHRPVRVSPQLRLAIDFIRPIEPRHAIFALKQEEVMLVYDEKSCPLSLLTYSHTDSEEITSLEACVDLKQAGFHQGHFHPGQSCELLLDGNLLAMVTIAEVNDSSLTYWDWIQRPAFLGDAAAHFDGEKTDCFVINLEFEILDLSFIKDYSIQKSRSEAYGLEVRLYSSVSAIDQGHAREVLDALKSLPYEFCQLKPGFYQLDSSDQLQNFECCFIIGDGSQYTTGRIIVI
jgi:hypothetical protein